MKYPMNLEFELKRAETVNRAMEEAASEFRRFFETKGFAHDARTPHRASRLHLGATFTVEAPHRVTVSFDGFWNTPAAIPLELLVTDDEKTFWMNTETNREYMTFDRALADAVDGVR